jgi:nucleoside-diphosphate-sugar epimerase
MLIKKDIDSLLTSGCTFNEFDESRITILGGTGFVGTWLVQALNQFSQNFGFSPQITVITRNARKAHELFIEKLGIKIKISEFDFAIGTTELEKSDFFINGATPSVVKTGIHNSEAVFASSVNASRSIIRSAKKHQNMPRVVNLSSGIVYGPQPLSETNQPERPILIKTNSQSGYLDAKIASELVFSEASDIGLVSSISPRLFAFAGPGIALDAHFAVGNFLRDGLQGKEVVIRGNPATVRSYMYPTDLATWVLNALINPKNYDFNIGSEFPIRIYDLAHQISELTSRKGVIVLGDDEIASNYVPSTSGFRKQFGVTEQVTLSDGLERWIQWSSQEGLLS